MADLVFEFSLLGDATVSDLAVQAGLDVDGDDEITEEEEIFKLKRLWGSHGGKLWRGKKSFEGDTKGAHYLVHFAVGKGVRWRLVIRSDGKDLIAPVERTTTTESTRWSGRLQK